MLSHQEAEILLHRYFASDTTLAEEHELRAYFRAGDVAPRLAALDPMFDYWDRAGKIIAPPARPAPVRRLQQRPAVKWLMATAAAVLLLFTANGWLDDQPGPHDLPIAAAVAQKKTPIDWSKYEVTDPEEAYRVLRSALKIASSEMNRSTRLTVQGINEMEKVLR
jgi:hypothetical protein